jgi:hypothetical protein
MPELPPSYKPGDIVNGHVLAQDGRWIPLNPEPGGAPPNQYVGQFSSQNGQPMVYIAADSSNNTSLAPVTSLVSGLIGVAFAWIPIIGVIGWVFGPLAVVFGVLGLRRGKAEHKLMSLIGIVCGAITLVICLGYVILFAVALNQPSTV